MEEEARRLLNMANETNARSSISMYLRSCYLEKKGEVVAARMLMSIERAVRGSRDVGRLALMVNLDSG